MEAVEGAEVAGLGELVSELQVAENNRRANVDRKEEKVRKRFQR